MASQFPGLYCVNNANVEAVKSISTVTWAKKHSNIMVFIVLGPGVLYVACPLVSSFAFQLIALGSSPV